MSLLKFASMFLLALIMTGIQIIMTVDQADAHCCSMWQSCNHTRWAQMFYGTIQKTHSKGNKFRLINKDGVPYDIRADQNVVKAFKEAKIETLLGIGIIGIKGKEPRLIAVATGADHGQGNLSANEILDFQMGNFPTAHPKLSVIP